MVSRRPTLAPLQVWVGHRWTPALAAAPFHQPLCATASTGLGLTPPGVHPPPCLRTPRCATVPHMDPLLDPGALLAQDHRVSLTPAGSLAPDSSKPRALSQLLHCPVSQGLLLSIPSPCPAGVFPLELKNGTRPNVCPRKRSSAVSSPDQLSN
jgi:hypothetical protein